MIAAAHPDSQRLQVLVVEDEPVDRLILSAAVRQLGYDCLEAEDGREAWTIFREQKPDIVVSDWQMPGLDGSDLCRMVRTSDGRAYTPFIFVTCHGDADHARRGMDAGADDFLTKPLHIDDLRSRLVVAGRVKLAENERLRLLEAERAARQAAERAVAQRDAVLAAVSHDLRTPLTSIRGQAALQRQRLLAEPQEPERLLAALGKIETAADRMNRWIDDLVDVTRLQDGQPLPLRQVAMNIVEIARQAIDEQPPSGRHILRLTPVSTLPVILCDPLRLRRVVDNLLSNAVKYSPNGGEITVGAEQLTFQEGSWIRLWVRDYGIGIPSSDLERIFEWSSRASNVGRIDGYGLGLAGARAIVEQHGGYLTVESEEGVGSTFSMVMPTARATDRDVE
jgi:two-component system, sensor histidine kinase and response regulator